MTPLNYRLYGNEHFVIEQCGSCFVPGYLIVSTQHEAASLSELSTDALAALGPTLARAVAAVQEIIQPIRIYCAQFGEGDHRLHFHVFPRTKEITEVFLRENPDQRMPIHGPLLLDWAREHYRDIENPAQAGDMINRLREAINAA